MHECLCNRGIIFLQAPPLKVGQRCAAHTLEARLGIVWVCACVPVKRLQNSEGGPLVKVVVQPARTIHRQLVRHTLNGQLAARINDPVQHVNVQRHAVNLQGRFVLLHPLHKRLHLAHWQHALQKIGGNAANGAQFCAGSNLDSHGGVVGCTIRCTIKFV